MNPFSLMKNDHQTAQRLFDEIRRTNDKKQKKALFKQLRQELNAHAYMEEKSFYPELEGDSLTHDITLQAEKEHHAMKVNLQELSQNIDDWDVKFDVLRENVEHHIQEEENELFSKAEKILGSHKEEVGDNMEAKKQEFMDDPRKW
jgi:hypothetical protein